MKLKELIRGFEPLKVVGSKEVEITGISIDSRRVVPGNLFIAKKGAVCDGTEFIDKAVEAGAAAIVAPIYNPFLKQTQVVSEHPEALEARVAARFYRTPSRSLWIAGVTGSKGKTTTSYLIHHLLTHLGRKAGLISTVETVIGEKRFFSNLTTHDAIFNQKLLREMVDCGSDAAILELSSHGLAQNRVDEIDFELAVFTNLYPDHLDYHKTVEEYAAAKAKIFQKAKFGIYNGDSPWTPTMRQDRPGLTFGIEAKADVRAENVCFAGPQCTFTIAGAHFTVPLLGRFNLVNVLGAIAAGVYLKIPLPQLSSIFSSLPRIPGRLEQIPNDLGIRIYVDYAHTGESLSSALKTLRELAQKKIIVVFGCGGGRDPARRSGMGAAGSQFADTVIVTADNPRNEDVNEICRQILAVSDPRKTILEIDRTKAIRLAIQMARPGDLVLIAGKGHEQAQIFAHQSIPFDDLLVAKQQLQNGSGSAILS